MIACTQTFGGKFMRAVTNTDLVNLNSKQVIKTTSKLTLYSPYPNHANFLSLAKFGLCPIDPGNQFAIGCEFVTLLARIPLPKMTTPEMAFPT
ncbi:hypothetical protein TNCV_430141 [Trichonephila clavipes]|nr:hypothetical protein TNCV_430141 [Trichonephila clavipes]